MLGKLWAKLFGRRRRANTTGRQLSMPFIEVPAHPNLLAGRTILWTGVVDNNWATPGNWQYSMVPGQSDVAALIKFHAILENIPDKN